MRLRSLIVPALIGPALAGCAETSVPSGARLAVGVAPLVLPGISDTCYGLTVYDAANAAGAVVWSQTTLCSTQYGNSLGDLTYVGTCVDENAAGATTNSVALVLEDLCTGGPCWVGGVLTHAIATTEYVNPCPADDPCVLDVPCEENTDALVEFNLTVMRDADQGFFDIAVNFEDVFCSAKLDCIDADDQPLTLLHDAAGERRRTAVFAVACTDGPDGGATEILMDDLVVRCEDGFTTTIDVTAGPGNLLTPPLDADTSDIFQVAVYEGTESLACTDPEGQPTSCGKLYWNTAVGLGERLATHGKCQVSSAFTAGSGFVNGLTPAGVYPVVAVLAPLTQGGQFVCTRYPLDAGSALGLTTGYTDAGSDGQGLGNVGHVVGGAMTTDAVVLVDGDGTVEKATVVTLGKKLVGDLGGLINEAADPDKYDRVDYFHLKGAGLAGTEVSFLVSGPCCTWDEPPVVVNGSCPRLCPKTMDFVTEEVSSDGTNFQPIAPSPDGRAKATAGVDGLYFRVSTDLAKPPKAAFTIELDSL